MSDRLFDRFGFDMERLVDSMERNAALPPASAPPGGVGDAGQDVERRPIRLAAGMRSWISSGACQGPDGAFHAWRDGLTGSLAFAYPEITGYALTYLAGRRNLSGREERAGREAGAWLERRLAARDLSARDGWDNGTVYNFDLAMIAAGLATFGDRSGSDALNARGLALASDLWSQLEAGELPALDRNDSDGSGRSGWSVDGRSHMLKAVQCFLLASEHGMTGGEVAAAEMVAASKNRQHSDGRFQTQQADDLTMLHPHLYTVEGLWMWGSARGDGDALARARSGVAWAWAQQLPTGGFPRSVPRVPSAGGPDASVEQCDVTAQVVRAALLLDLAPPGIDAAIGRIGQVAIRDGKLGWAMPYQPTSPSPHLNVWATMFAAQAMDLAAAPADALSWRHLV